MNRLEADGVCSEEKLPSVSSINRIVRSSKRYDQLSEDECADSTKTIEAQLPTEVSNKACFELIRQSIKVEQADFSNTDNDESADDNNNYLNNSMDSVKCNQQRHKGNCVCQTCVNKYKYMAANGQSCKLPSSSSSNIHSSTSSSPTDLSLNMSHCEHSSEQCHASPSPGSNKRKNLSVDTLAENLAQKRLRQQQQQLEQSNSPRKEDKFNINSLLGHDPKMPVDLSATHRHKSSNGKKSNSASPKSDISKLKADSLAHSFLSQQFMQNLNPNFINPAFAALASAALASGTSNGTTNATSNLSALLLTNPSLIVAALAAANSNNSNQAANSSPPNI